eukprot:11174332-Ditylum_brightwellii.AAC.1
MAYQHKQTPISPTIQYIDMVKELHAPHQAGTSTLTLFSRYTPKKPMDATSKSQQKTSHKKGTQNNSTPHLKKEATLEENTVHIQWEDGKLQ